MHLCGKMTVQAIRSMLVREGQNRVETENRQIPHDRIKMAQCKNEMR